MNEERKNILVEKSFDFSVVIVYFYKSLVENKKEFVLSKQLLRSGTAIGALIREAQNAESKMDFIHKLAIAQKECDETIYWLEILYKTDYITEDVFNLHYEKANELLKLLRSIILTKKKNIHS